MSGATRSSAKGPPELTPRSNREAHILALTLTSTQTLVTDLFNLPTLSSENGPIAQLPEPITLLPREKPLPKPKPPTKWERYAKAKGISHVKKDKKVWDEEKQDWVNRWGRDGKNREGEDQWLHEVKDGQGECAARDAWQAAAATRFPWAQLTADPTADPRSKIRGDRKARIAKNEKQHARNVADAQAHVSALDKKPSNATTSGGKQAARQVRKAELDRSMLISKTATASMGKFDRKIEGEPKVKGVKRKFDANVGDFSSEKESYHTLLGKLGVADRKKAPKKGGEGADGGVNVRKALRHEGRKAERSNALKKRKA